MKNLMKGAYKLKTKRQAIILELVKNNNIETQDELMHMLRLKGFEVTQATVSRDINELRLIKTPIGDGRYKYTIGNIMENDMSERFFSLFSTSILSVVYSSNIVVIKTFSGMAQAICASMDCMEWNGVLGTIAGDDTIFVATSGESYSSSLAKELNVLFNK